MATRSLTLQTRHQSAVKSTKTGVPEARSSASRAVLNVSWRFPSATSPEAVAALGASGIPTVRTPASASEAGASVNHPAEPRRWRRPYHHRDTAKSERTSRPKAIPSTPVWRPRSQASDSAVENIGNDSTLRKSEKNTPELQP